MGNGWDLAITGTIGEGLVLEVFSLKQTWMASKRTLSFFISNVELKHTHTQPGLLLLSFQLL